MIRVLANNGMDILVSQCITDNYLLNGPFGGFEFNEEELEVLTHAKTSLKFQIVDLGDYTLHHAGTRHHKSDDEPLHMNMYKVHVSANERAYIEAAIQLISCKIIEEESNWPSGIGGDTEFDVNFQELRNILGYTHPVMDNRFVIETFVTKDKRKHPVVRGYSFNAKQLEDLYNIIFAPGYRRFMKCRDLLANFPEGTTIITIASVIQHELSMPTDMELMSEVTAIIDGVNHNQCNISA